MPTVQEKAAEVARKIESALQVDGFTKQAAITESAVKKSRTAAALKQAERDLSSSLEEDKIVEASARLLRITADKLRRMLKEAGNDNYLQLIDLIDDLIGR